MVCAWHAFSHVEQAASRYGNAIATRSAKIRSLYPFPINACMLCMKQLQHWLCGCAVVLGNFDAVGLLGVARLQFASGAVQPVFASLDGTVLVGTARVINGNIPAANGVLHIIDDVLDDDISLNSTVVSVLADAGDYGPFNQTQASLPFSCVEW